MEQIYFSDNDVSVTNQFVRFGSRTYSVASLASVSLQKVRSRQALPYLSPNLSIGMVILSIAGLIFSSVNFSLNVGILTFTSQTLSWLCFLILVIILCLAFVRITSQNSNGRAYDYVVKIEESPGLSTTYPAPDESYAQKLVDAIQTAINRAVETKKS